jgi:hypothetical protein
MNTREVFGKGVANSVDMNNDILDRSYQLVSAARNIQDLCRGLLYDEAVNLSCGHILNKSSLTHGRVECLKCRQMVEKHSVACTVRYIVNIFASVDKIMDLGSLERVFEMANKALSDSVTHKLPTNGCVNLSCGHVVSLEYLFGIARRSEWPTCPKCYTVIKEASTSPAHLVQQIAIEVEKVIKHKEEKVMLSLAHDRSVSDAAFVEENRPSSVRFRRDVFPDGASGMSFNVGTLQPQFIQDLGRNEGLSFYLRSLVHDMERNPHDNNQQIGENLTAIFRISSGLQLIHAMVSGNAMARHYFTSADVGHIFSQLHID